jgi:SAM-dependent methyltransferase
MIEPRRSATSAGLGNLTFLEGRAEAIPAEDAAFSVVIACLSVMYVIDREAAASEIARVLKPGGRFVAAVWAEPEQCDIVLFQQTAGRFAAPPPVLGVGPGALAEPSGFLRQLDAAGIQARVETETLGFDFPDFTSAWGTLAGVTTAQLPPERQQEAKDAVMVAMYPKGDGRSLLSRCQRAGYVKVTFFRGTSLRPVPSGRNTARSKASPSIASLNTLTCVSLNSAVTWVMEVEGLRRALAA